MGSVFMPLVVGATEHAAETDGACLHGNNCNLCGCQWRRGNADCGEDVVILAIRP